MTFERFEIEFTKDGRIHDEAQVTPLLDAAPRLTDVFVLSHGWNNDKAEAAALYDALAANLADVLDIGVVDGLDSRRFGIVRLYWPSKRFADDDLIPGGGAASAHIENDEALLRLLEEMKSDPPLLGGSGSSAVRTGAIEAAQRLVPRLESDPAARREFVLHLRAILDPAAAHPDDGSEEFFTLDPEAIFSGLDGAVVAPAATGGRGGATSVNASGGAAGLGDLMNGFKAAARRIANYATYYEMKQRAGTVGATGVAPLLRRLRERAPGLRLHLAGHSFGGRLVTAAAHGLPAGTPAMTMTLLQAAYSHNGLASRFDGVHDGAFREVLSEARVSGPILITHTKNDRAVGIAYPLASRISRDQAAAVGDRNDPYGGMGRNGAQRTPEAEGRDDVLHAVGAPYSLRPGLVYNLNADDYIRDHGDVTGHEIAHALLSAAAAV